MPILSGAPGSPDSVRSGVIALAAAALIGLAPHPTAGVYPQNPPAAHTGGFGEPTCHQCHFGYPVNHSRGQATVSGIPPAYSSDSAYTLTVTVSREGMGAGGFQLATRLADGPGLALQAGSLAELDSRVEIVTAGRVDYAQHTLTGTALTRPGVAQWRLRWRAPSREDGTVSFHVAANAANDDRSEFGDFVYVWRGQSRASPTTP